MIDRLRSPRTLGPILATLAVLGLLGYDRFVLRVPAAEAATFHDRLKLSAELIPMVVGPWAGRDVDVPEAAVRMLQPNFIVSRRYQNVLTGEAFSFLIVQVKDARDILGHYPPHCYPGQGWQPVATSDTDWKLDDGAVTGTTYRFGRSEMPGGRELVVDNFMVLPDGQFCRNMEQVETAAQDRRRKAFGAAQVQFVFDGSIDSTRRQEITWQFIQVNLPILQELGSGVGS